MNGVKKKKGGGRRKMRKGLFFLSWNFLGIWYGLILLFFFFVGFASDFFLGDILDYRMQKVQREKLQLGVFSWQ